MRTLLIVVLALALGGVLARNWYASKPPVDPIQVIVNQVKTHAIVEHERQIAIWYKACPEVLGSNPEIFVAWPGKLSYELDLAKVEISRSGTGLLVKTAAIRADEPAVPTDFMDYLSTSPWFNVANEEALINQEIKRASPIARWLSVYFQRNDPSLRADFEEELGALVARLAGALGVEASEVKVEIPSPDVPFPKFPRLELCTQSTAAVNGVPFASMQDAISVPMRFNAAIASGRSIKGDEGAASGKPRGVIAGLLGDKKDTAR